ncbi:MAG: hypothetical protein UT02_C0014G0011 [Parcubacteria group bacterium GW2011_GWC2_38_7]|nr:MAG: hypothetical protein UT02_C0014G0011 [Parcubacteria group bacterium GW2011_GWC2_38_7]
MKKLVLWTILCLGFFLSACASQRENALISKAKKTFNRAEQLHKSNTCEDRESAARLLADLSTELDEASDDNPLENLELGKLQIQASNQYNTYVREGFNGNCCWAIGLVVQYAHDHLEILTSVNKQDLAQIKSYYLHACCNQQGEETASL